MDSSLGTTQIRQCHRGGCGRGNSRALGTANRIAPAKSSPVVKSSTLALLYQLARDGNRHLGITFPLELDPRTSTALVGVVKLGLVQPGGDNPLLRI